MIKKIYELSGAEGLLRDRRRPAPDVGGAVLLGRQARTAFVTSGGLGTMGFEVPAAIGAQFARPDDTVWAICGDGGFQMTMQELATARRVRAADQVRDHQQRLPGHGAPVAGAVLRRNNLLAVRMFQPDFVKLAEAYGHARHARHATRRRSSRRSRRRSATRARC